MIFCIELLHFFCFLYSTFAFLRFVHDCMNSYFASKVFMVLLNLKSNLGMHRVRQFPEWLAFVTESGSDVWHPCVILVSVEHFGISSALGGLDRFNDLPAPESLQSLMLIKYCISA